MKEEMNLSDLWGGCIWSSSKPMTNADRIRAMTDEELAEWIDFAQTAGVYTIRGKHAWLDWLKSPEGKNDE